MGFLSDNFIADGLLFVIRWLFGILGDYALVIIVMTVVIRLAMLPLDIRQRKNGRMMANIAPEVESLKKRYANNPDQLNRKTQELYRQKNIKPMAGCLPMIIQMILLFAYFGALRSIASEQTVGTILRAAQNGAESISLPQWLWVHNLWQPDSGLAPVLPSAKEFLSFLQQNTNNITPQTLLMLKNQGLISYGGGVFAVAETQYGALVDSIVAHNSLTGLSNGWFGLPILAGAGVLLQQRLTSKDNPQMSQNKAMMWIFPIFSIYICLTSNAAFSLYWLVSNVCAIALTLVMRAVFDRQDKKNRPTPAAPTA